MTTKTGVQRRYEAARKARDGERRSNQDQNAILTALHRYGALTQDELRSSAGLSKARLYRAVTLLGLAKRVRFVRVSGRQIYFIPTHPLRPYPTHG